jgi:hypothetical protein
VEFNNLTKENMIHCDYSNAKTARIDWEKALNAIPKEIL